MTTTEDALLARARRFDRDALGEIYDLFSPGIYRYAYRLLGDTLLAEDCVAETFSNLLKALHAGRGPAVSIRAYLYRVAHNWVTDQYRRQPPPPFPLTDELTSTGDNPAEIASLQIEQAQVREALRLLTPEQRQVIVLKYLEGWENKAIAQALGKPVGAVKALQHRAVEALKRILLPKEEIQRVSA